VRDVWITGAVDPSFEGRFCAPWKEDETTDTTAYPLRPVSFDTFIGWVWRVRTWSVQFYAMVSQGSSTSRFYASASVPTLINGRTYAESIIKEGEEYKTGAQRSAFTGFDARHSGDLFAGGNGEVAILGKHRVDTLTHEFNPAFVLNFNCADVVGDVGLTFSTQPGVRDIGKVGRFGSSDASGIPFKLYLSGAFAHTVTATASVIVTPESYHERRAKNGTVPLYNVDTGTPLVPHPEAYALSVDLIGTDPMNANPFSSFPLTVIAADG